MKYTIEVKNPRGSFGPFSLAKAKKVAQSLADRLKQSVRMVPVGKKAKRRRKSNGLKGTGYTSGGARVHGASKAQLESLFAYGEAERKYALQGNMDLAEKYRRKAHRILDGLAKKGSEAYEAGRAAYEGKRANPARGPRGEADPEMAHELVLFIDNESSLYPQYQSIRTNLLRKLRRGKYDPVKAPKIFLYLIKSAIPKYKRDFATPDFQINVPTQRLAAQELANRFLHAAQTGEYDYLLDGAKPTVHANPARWTKADKLVMKAFVHGMPAESKKLRTDGKQLDGLWMGGTGLAYRGGAGVFDFPDTGSKTGERVQKMVQKLMSSPRPAMLASNPKPARAKKAPGAYASFVKSRMPHYRSKGVSSTAAMSAIAAEWRAKH